MTTKTAIRDFTKAIYLSDLKNSLPPKREFYLFMTKFIEERSSPKKTDPSPKIKSLKEEYERKLGKKPKGPKTNDADWLKSKISESESSDSDSDSEVAKLKKEYTDKLGKKPKGPKTNDADWLRSKIAESELPDTELTKLKKEYIEKFDKKPSGPKANNIEWLKSKLEIDVEDEEEKNIRQFFEETKKEKKEEESDEESEEEEKDEEESDEEKDEEEKEVDHGPIKFRFEGVEYTKIYEPDTEVWGVEDEDKNMIGEWIESKQKIHWDEECWEEIHQEDDDYTGE